MKKYRHSVEKIRPEISTSFDQHFWPVLVAIIVLCSIAAGAISTLVKGPWMWGSLLVLPAAAAAAIFLLYRLDDNFLRRSLQFAIVISLALHLLVLILSSLTFIFGVAIPQEKAVVRKSPEQRIVVSNRTRKFVFQETPKHKVEDQQKIEPDKKQPATEQKNVQPLPVVEQKPTLEPQLTKREIPQKSISRLARKPSQRSRNDQVKPSSKSSSSQARLSQEQPQKTTAAPSSTLLTRTEPSQSQPKKSASSAAANAKITQSQASRRRERAQQIQKQASNASARMRRDNTRIPKVAKTVSNNTNSSNTKQNSKTVARSEPASTSVQRSNQSQSTIQKTSKLSANPTTSKARSITERRTNAVAQIKSTTAAKKSARQSITQSPTARSNPQFNQASASSNQSRPVAQPKAVAVSKAASGKSGAGRSNNLERTQGGEPSPVNIASNASSKRQSNRLSENISMTSSQRSPTMERGRSSLSSRTLRSETADWATKSGSNVPAQKTAQASSASIDSANASSRNSFASEKGTSMLDIGSTKVVPETVSDRRGGGGQPELSNYISQQPAKQSGRKSAQLPTVAQNNDAAFAGPVSSSSSMEVTADQGLATNEIDRKVDGSPGNNISGKSESLSHESIRQPSVSSSSIAARRENKDSNSLEAGSTSEIADDRSSQGNDRTRIAQAPNIARTVDLGESGDANVEVANSTNEGADLSTSELASRAVDSLGSGTVLNAASKVMAGSLAGMPLFGNGQSESRRRSDESLIGSRIDESARSTSRSGRSLSPSVEVSMESSSSLDSEPNVLAADSGSTDLNKRSLESSSKTSSVALDIEAPSGSGGFGKTISRRVGSLSEAISESDNLSPTSESRFKRKDFGGVPSVSPNVSFSKKAFSGRNPANLANSGPQTEKAIELGLEFLASCQLADGSWTLGQFDNDDPYYQNILNSDAAATGLALLAFQGAGYNHREFKYANQIKNAIDWLVDNQSNDGRLYVDADKVSNESCLMYSHAIAALAMAEAYGMTQDPTIREPAQRALDYIANTQHARKGGWRYFANPNRRSSDTSVTGWMMMALKGGQLAGLDVQPSTMDGIEKWLRVAEAPDSPSEFRYNPYAANSDGRSRTHGKRASVTMTSVGLLMRVYTGWGPSNAKFQAGARTLLSQMPSDADSLNRDTYYWYYATQVMKHAGGDLWEQWSSALHPLLVNTQEQTGPMRGSWHPYKPVPDRWAPQGGRIYVTTMNLLSLEVKYRLLPLYEYTIKSE